MRVKADRFEELPLTLDLTKMDEYQELNFDLFVADVKMAVVSGKILDKKTGANLKAISTAKINVEGQSDVFAKIDTVNATYELKLKPGSQYTISASAPNYYPLYEVVDASGTTGNIKISKDLIIVPIEVGQSIRLNNIFFDAGKSILKKESFSELDRVADFLTKNPEIKVEISGHTDNVGGAATNQKLSQSRAQSVADYVVKKGIPKDKVVAKGYGLAKPVASNATKEGKAQNRRVEFTILDK
jgi:OOP family OmpA-OmpF porin